MAWWGKEPGAWGQAGLTCLTFTWGRACLPGSGNLPPPSLPAFTCLLLSLTFQWSDDDELGDFLSNSGSDIGSFGVTGEGKCAVHPSISYK